jgi:energy-coupling factor transporter ATP-binding protein EcfA2
MARDRAAKRAQTGNGKHAKGAGHDETVGLGAYFLSLTLENVRCFAKAQTLRLADAEGRPARWTVLLGENGMGKTTLLQTLVTAAPAHFGLWEKDASAEWAFYTWASGALELWTIAHLPRGTPPFEGQGAVSTVEARLKVSYGLLEPGPETSLGYTIRPRRGPLGLHVSNEGGRATPTPGGRFRGVGPFNRVFLAAYGPYRRLSPTSLVEPDERGEFYVGAFETLFDSDAMLPNAEEWYLQRDYEAAKTGSVAAEQQRDRVRDILLRVLPGVSEITPRFGEPGAGKARLFAKTGDGLVPVSELGLGYQSTLAWVTDLAVRLFAAFPESPDPLAEPCVVLVDEIDLHLHPRWQRTLLDAISSTFPNAQFIVTAHSPLVVQAAPDANLAVLRRRGDHVVIEQAPDAVRHWRVDQILTSDLFGLPSARPAALDASLKRRDEILAKDTLTQEDEAELATLRERIAALPGGETPLAMEAEEILRRAAKQAAAEKPRPGAKPRARRA